MDKISLYFWQNCISPHQLPYIKELHKDNRIHKVYLIAPIYISPERKLMGWANNNNNEGVEIVISPNKYEVEKLFQNNQQNSVHLFTGIRADKTVYEYFKISLCFNVKRGIITEPPFNYKTPLLLHKIRFLLFDYKYISKIDYVFGMGEKAVNYYKLLSKRWQVFLFGYCVDIEKKILLNNQHNDLRFLYVGSLIKRKNVFLLLKAIRNNVVNANFTLDIIGDGSESVKLLNYVDKHSLNSCISFLGKFSMDEIHQKNLEYDVLILPSIHDGWGAVINEGLQSGLFVISSDNCGANTLIEGSNRGIIFKNRSLKSLSNALNDCIINSAEIKLGKKDRILWSEKISGKSLARYMVDCLCEIESVLPPWKIN